VEKNVELAADSPSVSGGQAGEENNRTKGPGAASGSEPPLVFFTLASVVVLFVSPVNDYTHRLNSDNEVMQEGVYPDCITASYRNSGHLSELTGGQSFPGLSFSAHRELLRALLRGFHSPAQGFAPCFASGFFKVINSSQKFPEGYKLKFPREINPQSKIPRGIIPKKYKLKFPREINPQRNIS